MSIYRYEQAFQAADKTTKAMRNAIDKWLSLYYQRAKDATTDPCQQVAYTVVAKLLRAVFGEYAASATEEKTRLVLQALNEVRREALQQMLVGGECYLKPWLEGDKLRFLVIPRDRILVFSRDPAGEPTDVGTVEKTTYGNHFYTLLERRRVDEKGQLVIEYKLYRANTAQELGSPVALLSHPSYGLLQEKSTYPAPAEGVGFVRLKTPMLNCVDGSADGVSVYAAVTGLIENIDRNEALMTEEFEHGRSRLVVSGDLLGEEGFTDSVFVGLDDDPEHLGITAFSPNLRYEAYLERKQEYLRNVESVVGLRRGMLTDAHADDRTATEIASSAGDYNLTVTELQKVWQEAMEKALETCRWLYGLMGMKAPAGTISVDWGNGVLFDEDKAWEGYRQMVLDGLLRPEIALGWRFGMEADTPQQQSTIRQKLMPETV